MSYTSFVQYRGDVDLAREVLAKHGFVESNALLPVRNQFTVHGTLVEWFEDNEDIVEQMSEEEEKEIITWLTYYFTKEEKES